jgi:RNA polymerase sigma-70 factor (ECF subfamily)
LLKRLKRFVIILLNKGFIKIYSLTIKPKSILNEQQLIRELKSKNEQAFKMLVQTYKNMVFNTVLGIVQNIQEAEDVAQEVFIQIFNSIDGFREQSKLSTWIYRISITKSLDFVKSKKAKKRFDQFKNVFGLGKDVEETIPDFHHPGVSLDKKEDASILFKAIQQLPENQKIAFVLIKTEGLSYSEVANILNISEKAIEGLMHRAKENLRKLLNIHFEKKITTQ